MPPTPPLSVFYENAVASLLTIFSCDSVDTFNADNVLAQQAGLITGYV